MQYALSLENNRILPEKGSDGICPCCRQSCIPKCGNINIHHWAHITKDCDNWTEPETLWHKNWKNVFPVATQETIIEKENVKHIADVQLGSGLVIEFQNSPLSLETMLERESFYYNMIWILNAEKWKDNVVFKDKGEYISFRWKHPRKCWWNSYKPIFWDFGEMFFQPKRIYDNIPCGGYGYFIDKQDFVTRLLRSN